MISTNVQHFKMEIESTEWDSICRICLQEGQMQSIFDQDDESTDLTIADKVMQCSSIEVSFCSTN